MKSIASGLRKLMAYAVCLAVHGIASAQDVSFKSAFEAAAAQDVIVIQVPDDRVLIIEAGTYVTGGRRLIVAAQRARLAGETRLAFFAPETRPPSVSGVAGTGPTGVQGGAKNCGRDGCAGERGGVGATGTEGLKGAAASSMLLDIQYLDGAGKLIVLAAGQGGGKGQKGGKGGTGGNGSSGAKRSCGGALGLDTRAGPGNGGDAGAGGPGGVGGRGGIGGDGGLVTLAANLGPAMLEQVVQVDLLGAPGGTGGDPGEPGDPGAFGGMGGGNSCGGGGRNGRGNIAGPGGSQGAVGPGGTQGRMRFVAESIPTETQVRRRVVDFAAPAARDCRDAVHQFTRAESLGSTGSVIVAYNAAKFVSASGIEGIESAPVVLPSGGSLDAVRIATSVRRLRIPTVEVSNGFPPRITVRMRCPEAKVRVEYEVETVPASSLQGSSLRTN